MALAVEFVAEELALVAAAVGQHQLAFAAPQVLLEVAFVDELPFLLQPTLSVEFFVLELPLVAFALVLREVLALDYGIVAEEALVGVAVIVLALPHRLVRFPAALVVKPRGPAHPPSSVLHPLLDLALVDLALLVGDAGSVALQYFDADVGGVGGEFVGVFVDDEGNGLAGLAVGGQLALVGL